MKLTAENVQTVYQDCVVYGYKADEGPRITPDIHGVIHRVQFWQAKIDKHADDIHDMLDELPAGFHAAEGGGWSFFQACMNREGEQWGEHIHMEMVFLLGLALGRVREPDPMKDMRAHLPGGMPYYVIDRRRI